MIQSKDLDERLKQLGWRVFYLAKQVSEIRANRGNITTASRINSTIAKAIDNPAKSALETLEDIVTALGGELQITWSNLPGGKPTHESTDRAYLLKYFENGIIIKVEVYAHFRDALLVLSSVHSKDTQCEIYLDNEFLYSSADNLR